MSRQLIIVDCESSGLRTGIDCAVEIAWHNLDTGAGGSFIPAHDRDWVRKFGQTEALEINGYLERIYPHAPVDKDSRDQANRELARLHEALSGNTLAGANPRVDAAWLADRFACGFDPLTPAEPWHHRLVDVSNQAAALLGIDPRRLPGLWDVCRMLDVKPGDHTAAEDVRATVECFQRLDFLQRHPVELRDLRAGLPGVAEFAGYFGEVTA